MMGFLFCMKLRLLLLLAQGRCCCFAILLLFLLSCSSFKCAGEFFQLCIFSVLSFICMLLIYVGKNVLKASYVWLAMVDLTCKVFIT